LLSGRKPAALGGMHERSCRRRGSIMQLLNVSGADETFMFPAADSITSTSIHAYASIISGVVYHVALACLNLE
jgi:hypothetical protein